MRSARAVEAHGRTQPAVASAENATLGHQLDRRVQQGAISPEQAQKTQHEREILEAVYGKEWRDRIPMPESANGQSFREMRTALAGEGQENPALEQAYQEAIKSRLEAVERARQTLKGRRRRRGAVDSSQAVEGA